MTVTHKYLAFGSITISVLLLPLNVILTPVAILLGCLMAALLVWLARPIFLPALVILNLQATDFKLQSYGTVDHLYQQFEANYVMLGGFPLTVNLIFALTLGCRIFYEALISWRTYGNRRTSTLLALWVCALAISALISLKSRSAGFIGWSDPIRTVFIVGSYFYGFILLKRWQPQDQLFFRWLLPLFTILSVLAVAGFMHSRFNWVIATLMPAAVGLCLFRRAPGLSWAWVGFICSGVYCFHGPLGGYLSADDSGFASTFTLRGLFIFSTCLTTVTLLPIILLKNVAANLAGLPAILVAVTFTVFVTANYEKYSIGSEYMADSANPTISERLQSKIFDDRALLWNNSWSHIMTQNSIFPTAGAPIFYHHPKQGPIYVTMGSHNVYIHQIRLNGFIAGSLILIIYCFTIYYATKVLRYSQKPELIVFAISGIVTNLFGGITGHYVIGPNVSFFTFALIGVAYGASAVEREGLRRVQFAHPNKKEEKIFV